MWKQFVVVSVAGIAVACGGKGQRDAEAPSWMEEDVEPAPAESQTDAPVADEPAAPRPAGKVLVAGHEAARYEFVVPEGLVRVRGNVAQEGESQEELDRHGPDGVGIPGQVPIALDAVVVFSDPLGLGIDMISGPADERAQLIGRYDHLIRGRFPSATLARLVRIGAHTAIRIDLPRVEMPDRPVRSGRHYLVLDGTVTVSVDCLWTKANAERMSAACDAVAASLRRRP